MKKILFVPLIMIPAVCLLVSCAGTANPAPDQGKTDARFPGTPEETRLLESWEKAVRTRDVKLLQEIMPEPILNYTQETGEVVTFRGADAFIAFRLDFFATLGPRTDYRLPKVGEYRKNNPPMYRFEYPQARTSEMIYLGDFKGTVRIVHMDIVTFASGPMVMNRLQALGDRNGDGFLTKEDGSPSVVEMEYAFFQGPHANKTPYDAFFDTNKDGSISAEELRDAVEACFRRGFRFVRDHEKGLTAGIDLNNDGGLDDGEIDRIADFMLGKTRLDFPQSRFLDALWWYPIADAVFQDVPRAAANYLDEAADGNGDGRIDAVEQSVILASLKESHAVVNYLERVIDRNRDGWIDWNESKLAMQAAATGKGARSTTRPPYPVATAADRLLDGNGDSLVDALEVNQTVLLLSGERSTAEGISLDLKAFLDADRNGVLDQGEIEAGKARLLFPRKIDAGNQPDKAWDRNGDGYLSAAELGITAGESNGNPVAPYSERIDLYRRRGGTERISREKEAVAAGRSVGADAAPSGYQGRIKDLKDSSLAVLEIAPGLGAPDLKVAGILSLFVENAFVNAGSVKIVDRKNLDKVMQETSLQLSGAVSEGTAVRIGRLSGAQMIAVGEINRIGGTYYLSVKLIAVESGQIFGSSISQGQGAAEFLAMANKAVSGLF